MLRDDARSYQEWSRGGEKVYRVEMDGNLLMAVKLMAN